MSAATWWLLFTLAQIPIMVFAFLIVIIAEGKWTNRFMNVLFLMEMGVFVQGSVNIAEAATADENVFFNLSCHRIGKTDKGQLAYRCDDGLIHIKVR